MTNKLHTYVKRKNRVRGFGITQMAKTWTFLSGDSSHH